MIARIITTAEIALDVRERIEARIDKRDCGYETPCWVWTGAKGHCGHGSISVRYGPSKRRAVRVHRAAYELHFGPIPDGLPLDHLCCNPPCCNPAHLEPVTPRENTVRATRLKTHCPQGHPYDADNTHVTPQGWRSCKICQRTATREWRKQAALNAGRKAAGI